MRREITKSVSNERKKKKDAKERKKRTQTRGRRRGANEREAILLVPFRGKEWRGEGKKALFDATKRRDLKGQRQRLHMFTLYSNFVTFHRITSHSFQTTCSSLFFSFWTYFWHTEKVSVIQFSPCLHLSFITSLFLWPKVSKGFLKVCGKEERKKKIDRR